MKITMKEAGAMAAALVVGLAGGALAHGGMTEPTVVTKEVPGATQYVNVPGPTEVQTVTVEKEVQVEVPVDNGKLAELETFLWDHNGDAAVLLDDLKESEKAQIAERVVFLNDAQALAEEAVRKEAVDQLHREIITLEDNSTVKLDKSDIERVRVQDDPTDITLSDMDFDRGDVDVLVPITFEQDDVKLKADLLVLIRDGVVDDVVLDSVSPR